MRTKMLLIILAAASLGVLFCWDQVVFGQESTQEENLILFGGLGQRDYDDRSLFLEKGVFGEVGAIYSMGEHLGFEGAVSYGTTEADLSVFEPCCAETAALTGEDVSVWEGRGNLLLFLTTPSSVIRPYISGGVGGYSFSSDAEALDGSAWAMNVGGGLLVRTAGPVLLRVDGRYNPAQCEWLERETLADSYQIAVGIAWMFGRDKTPHTAPPVEEAPEVIPAAPECVPPRHLDSMMMGGRTYKQWGAWFTPSDGVAWRKLNATTIEGYALYVYGGAAAPFSSIFVEACGQFLEFRIEEEVTGTTG